MNKILVLCDAQFNDRPEAPDVIYIEIDQELWFDEITEIALCNDICLVSTDRWSTLAILATLTRFAGSPIVGDVNFFRIVGDDMVPGNTRRFVFDQTVDVETMIEKARSLMDYL